MESTIVPKPERVEARLERYSGVIAKQAGDDPAKLEEVRNRFREELGAVEKHRYIVLTPTNPEKLLDEEKTANRMLVFQSAYSKTTLKGFGRQFHASLDTESVISVLGSCSGGARSGRFETQYVLAIVSPDYPLIRRFSEGGETTTTLYPPKEAVSVLDELLEQES